MATITKGRTFTSGETVTPAKLNDAVDLATVTDIVNADIKSDAAIAGSKIAPDFGSQSVSTTGQAAVGTAINANVKLNVGGTMPAQTVQRALAVAPAFDNNASVSTQAIITGPSTASNGGSSYTIPSLTHFYANQGTLHADSTVTDQYGLFVASTLTGATNNYGVRSAIASAANRWNIYADGTAPNHFNGATHIGVTSFAGNGGVSIIPDNSSGAASAIWNRANTASSSVALQFRNNTSAVGSITYTNTATSFNVSSDYRLKQNVEPMTGGLAKLAQLKPSTFEFKAEPNVKVDGFIAHEVQAVVPQAVTGEKDGEEMQGLDMSKLVPVLVAAVQELSARVAELEAK